MRKLMGIILFLWSYTNIGQVTYMAGSYDVASATGSGASGIPTLSYTTIAGTSRVLLFYMIVERDHKPDPKGDNWASNAPTGGSVPTVEISTTTLTHINSQWYYNYEVSATETNAVISLEMMVYGTLEANIPSGTNSFSITSDYNTPASAGDEAIFGAVMFENVASLSNITNSDCSSCNSISTSNVSPNDGNNAVVSIAAAGSDRTFTAGTDQTLIGTSSVSNSSGTYTDASYSEKDGISMGLQYRTGTILNSTSDFSISGSADIFGAVESAYRLVSTNLLPVELIEFTVESFNGKNKLRWVTGSETNNSHFEVERSSDGFHWDKIGIEEGYGTTSDSKEYEFVDEDISCSTCYYRLKQVDFDGQFEYSKTESVVSDLKEDFYLVQEGNSRVYIYSSAFMNNVKLIGLDGKIMFNSGNTRSKNYQINLNALNSGTYFVVAQNATGIVSRPLVVK